MIGKNVNFAWPIRFMRQASLRTSKKKKSGKVYPSDDPSLSPTRIGSNALATLMISALLCPCLERGQMLRANGLAESELASAGAITRDCESWGNER
jgi:hypothetical protein